MNKMTTDKIYTTLKAIRAKRPCGLELGSGKGYDKLRKTLGKDYGDETPVTFRQIYESNGYDDTLWCLRCVDPVWDGLIRHFAVDCAEDVRHLMTDQRSLDALVVARKYADGLATEEELEAAWAAARAAWAAWAAARAASVDAARAAAWAAARAASVDAAGDSARAASVDAAGDSARAAAGAAAWAAAWDSAVDAAGAAAGGSAGDSAWAAAERKQMERLFIYCEKGERP